MEMEAKRRSVWAQGLFVVCFPHLDDGFWVGKGAQGTTRTFSVPSAGDTAPDTRPLGEQEHKADLISLQSLAPTSVHTSCSLHSPSYCIPFCLQCYAVGQCHRSLPRMKVAQWQGSYPGSISLLGADLQGCIPFVLCSHH